MPILSWITGWINVFGWMALTATAGLLGSQLIVGIIPLYLPGYVLQRWHGTLITIAIIFNAIMFNTFLAVKLPLIEGILLGLHVCGVFAIVVRDKKIYPEIVTEKLY